MAFQMGYTKDELSGAQPVPAETQTNKEKHGDMPSRLGFHEI